MFLETEVVNMFVPVNLSLLVLIIMFKSLIYNMDSL